MADVRRRVWNGLAVLTVAGALASFANTAQSGNLGCVNNSACGCVSQNCTAPGDGGLCLNGSCQCNPGYVGPFCEPFGACCGVDICAHGAAAGQPQAVCGQAGACTELTQATCESFNGTFAGVNTTCASGICDMTATATATSTATATATATNTATATSTATPVPQGGGCTNTSECDPGLTCSDAVCCNVPCTAPGFDCNLPGQVGTCAAIPAAPAPAASNGGLLLMLGALMAVAGGAIALRGRKG